MNHLIINAISNKKLVRFNYNDLTRVVEPHCYCNTVKGDEALRACQVGGNSSTGLPGWKLFHLSKIGSIQILDENFNDARPDYKPGDKGMQVIYIEI